VQADKRTMQVVMEANSLAYVCFIFFRYYKNIEHSH